MCGIFGMISSDYLRESNIDYLKKLGAINAHRGNQAFGIYCKTEGSEQIIRHNTPFYPDAFQPLWYANTILVHLLSSTGIDKRIHPFEVDNLIFAHNGLLLNYKQLQGWSNLGPVDSQYLFSGIIKNFSISLFLEDAIKNTIQVVEGQQACFLYDKATQSLYLWRVMSPLYIREGDPFIFSSAEFENSVLLEEGHIYRLSQYGFEDVETFNFYSPYMETK